jgi:hypothetical protein
MPFTVNDEDMASIVRGLGCVNHFSYGSGPYDSYTTQCLGQTRTIAAVRVIGVAYADEGYNINITTTTKGPAGLPRQQTEAQVRGGPGDGRVRRAPDNQ